MRARFVLGMLCVLFFASTTSLADEASIAKSLEALKSLDERKDASKIDPAARIRALRTLTKSGKASVPFLIEALKHEKSAYWAALALNRIGPDAAEAVPALAEVIEHDKRMQVRREAILALAEIGKAAAGATPQLLKAIDNEYDRIPAIYALGRIGEPLGGKDEKIYEYLDNTDKLLAAVSIWTLARLHPENKSLVTEATNRLFEGLKSDNARLRMACARGLVSLHPGPEIFLPAMEKAFVGADEKAVRGGLDALAQLGPAAVPKLIEALKYKSIRPYVIYILGQKGPAAKSAVDALAKFINDKDPVVQHEALIALAKIGPASKAALPDLLETLKEQKGSLCCAATYALGSIGPDAKVASTMMMKNLESDDATLALLSAWALTQIEPENAQTAEKTLPVLLKGLEHSEPKFRCGAAEALGKLGPPAKPAIPALQKALQDDKEEVRKAAAAAIKAIGG
ncbi:MAG: HEAT repeat domain-containing protein [Thermoguttaceae bacterium]